MLTWYPVVEPEIPGVERFLTDQPINLVKSGNFYQVPLITGVVRDEFGAFNISEIITEKNYNRGCFNCINFRSR